MVKYTKETKIQKLKDELEWTEEDMKELDDEINERLH